MFNIHINEIIHLRTLCMHTIVIILTGAIYHYVIVNMTLWWFFHLCIFLHKVVAPFHAKRTERLGRQKYIFGVTVFLGKHYLIIIVASKST